eukprot:jgi/Chlat1/8633/Chrsp86S00658
MAASVASAGVWFGVAVGSNAAVASSSKPSTRRPQQQQQPAAFNGLRSGRRALPTSSSSSSSSVAAVTLEEKISQHARSRTTTSSPSSKQPTRCGMNIVFVSAEVAPWSKTGGLGDVLGGLPAALAARGHRVMTISPRYDQYKDAWDTDTTAEVDVGGKKETVRFFHTYKRGVDRVFVDHEWFLSRVWGKTGGKIYGERTGVDYTDNQLRFSLFAQAALKAPLVLNLDTSKDYSGPYGEDVVFIANDWHTALLPLYMKSQYKPIGRYSDAKASNTFVIFCVHNVAYQGRFALSDFSLLGLPSSFRPSFHFVDGYEKPVKGPKINWMKAGFLEADKVMTVSPNYAEEMLSGPERGVELDDVLKTVDEWDPATDKYLDQNFDITTIQVKGTLKEALQAELVVLGTGKAKFEKQLEELEEKYPDQARGVVKFSVPLAHMITGGADYMLVPSRFEPCGLIQLHAMRYGTIPVVATTGGLADTVREGVTGFQMGCFDVDCETVNPEDVEAIVEATKRALSGPAKDWEQTLLDMLHPPQKRAAQVGLDKDEVGPRAKENIATP